MTSTPVNNPESPWTRIGLVIAMISPIILLAIVPPIVDHGILPCLIPIMVYLFGSGGACVIVFATPLDGSTLFQRHPYIGLVSIAWWPAAMIWVVLRLCHRVIRMFLLWIQYGKIEP